MAGPSASALEVVLHDVAPDRVERQRAFSRGELPIPGTPRLDMLDERLKERGLAQGRAIYIRIFKAESELELWMQNSSGTFTHLATYPICHWHGTIGPKLKEGDKQSPEGFYSVGIPQTRLVGRWRKAFNLGFPNLHDQLLSRTGSYILVHGGCSSVGCFAMTDPVQDEIYGLARAALAAGQERFQVHVFPFRMTDANLVRFGGHPWAHTWADLKPAYDSFERTRVPPKVIVCGIRYQVADGLPGETGGTEKRLPVLRPASRVAASADLTVVIDSRGQWSPPSCTIEDEARRKAAYAMTTSATVEGLAGPEAAASPLATGSVVPDAIPSAPKPVVDDEARTRTKPAAARSGRRAARDAPDTLAPSGAVPPTDGFGTALNTRTGRSQAVAGN
ncbi:MAG: hypothetical protein SFW09_15260 [Hyphomicrobiaceae bacterium]|nr:hypothetical protein [Hyphomicrobiaceae bacterium]